MRWLLILALFAGLASATVKSPPNATSANIPSGSVTGNLNVPSGGSITTSGTGTVTATGLSGAVVRACNYSGSDVGAQINAAIAALPSTGGIVDGTCYASTGQTISTAINIGSSTQPIALILGSGKYTTSAIITLAKTSSIIGQPAAMGIGSTNNGPTIIIAAAASNLPEVISLTSGGFSVLQDLVVDGNSSGNPSNTTGDAILFTDSNRPTVTRVTAQNAPRYGFNYNSADSIGTGGGAAGKFSQVMAIDNGAAGFYCYNSNDTFISDSEFENNSTYGVQLANCSATRINHSDISGNVSGGFYASASAGSRVSSSTQITTTQFGINQGHDIDIEGASFTAPYFVLNGNSFIGMAGTANTYDNIHINAACNGNIVGNSIGSFTGTGQSRYGIYTSDTTGCNTVAQNTTYGTFGTQAYYNATNNQPSPDNRIINPDFALDQYHAGLNNTFTPSGTIYFADRWAIQTNTGESWTSAAEVTSTSCNGTTNASKFALTLTAGTGVTPTSSQLSYLTQHIDGGDILDFAFSSSGAQTLVLSFFAKINSGTATESVEVSNGAHTRSYVTTVPLTTTCTYFVIPIAGDTAGTWNIQAGVDALEVGFDLGSGTTYQTSTLNTWQGSRYIEATGATQLGTTTGTVLTITGVRLRTGIYDVPRIPRSYDQELILARQFYNVSFPSGTAPAQSAGVAGSICSKIPVATSYASLQIPFGTPMRKTPTITTYNPSANNANWRDVTAGADVTVSVDPSTAIGVNGFEVTTSATVANAADNLCIHYVASGEI